ncbi:peptidoglycan -binding protein [Algicella marina]|uniref:Peptidoglycan-binding protein n=1 Tax=Algicella marina TaxID=2683284 RepID=A0A6P1SXK8_9RHOB|nr:peptidoglycan -binding protein [Algicella marina]QHQ33739.1 peptidoglycan -binding protein [Algicella marina]
MALTRRSGSRFEANIWPGFVDAMTALLLVLMFVLSIFMIVQFVLRETIDVQENELNDLSGQVATLADALGLEQQSNDRLETQVGSLSSQLSDAEAQAAAQAALISTLTDERDAASARIASFEEQVASLLARNEDLTADVAARDTQLAEAVSDAEALEIALAAARTEIDAGAEAARRAAAEADAMEALIADLRSNAEDLQAEVDESQSALSEAEQSRLVEAAAAEALRQRLADSDAELTAMSLRLEEERKAAQETLTMLAAVETARRRLEAAQPQNENVEELVAEKDAALEQARELLSQEKEISAESQRQVALLNQQTRELNRQLSSLQALLDQAREQDELAQIQIEALGSNLNTALARVASEERRRAALEEAERKRLEEEARNLENYRSEFFGRVREILGDREGVEIVGDRFIFSSEVLFEPGSAFLGSEGRNQIAEVAEVIRTIRGEIPPEINWILRVDGHTDNIPTNSSRFADNWELSQARALSVVKYLIDSEDIPADRLAANGFGEFQPVDPANTPEARARNRRIELKFTER